MSITKLVELLPESVGYSMHSHATRLRRRFPMCGHEDIVQEQWLWVLTHERKVRRYLDDEDNGLKKLSRALRNAGLAFCHREKAASTGYEIDDLYFYSGGLLRELLPAVWDDDAWVRVGRSGADGQPGGKSLPNEGNNVIACLIDVRSAVERLPTVPRELLHLQFRDGMTDEAIAAELDITKDAAHERVSRAIGLLQQELGGERPDWAAASAKDDE